MPRGLPFIRNRQRPLRSPLELADLAFWYDPFDPSSMVIDGSNRVALWADKSPWSRVNCLILNGVSANTASLPDSAALSITGNIEIEADLELHTLPSGDRGWIISKWANSNGLRSYGLTVHVSGALELVRSTDGTAVTISQSSAVVPFALLTRFKCRVTLNTATQIIQFFTSPDGVTWTQLGTDIAAGAGGIYDSAQGLFIGKQGSDIEPLNAKIYRVIVRNGIDGTIALDSDFTRATKLATSFTEFSANAATVTINTSGATGARISGARDIYWGTVAGQPVYRPATPAVPQASTSAPTQNAYPYDSLTSGSASGVRLVAGSTAGARIAQTNGSFAIYPGQAVTVSFTATQNSGDVTGLIVSITGPDETEIISASPALSVGANSHVLTTTVYRAAAFITFKRPNGNAAVDVTISDLVISVSGISSPDLYLDGSNDALKSANFSFAQPATVQIALSQVIWAAPGYIFDGISLSAGALQTGTTPAIALDAGAGGPSTSALLLGVRGVLSVSLNGASSTIRVNRGAAAIGNAGTNAMNGYTLGMRADGINFPSQIAAGEQIGRSSIAATSTYEQDRFVEYVARKGKIAA